MKLRIQVHLNPGEEELWSEDLAWVQALIAHKHKEKEEGEEVLPISSEDVYFMYVVNIGGERSGR